MLSPREEGLRWEQIWSESVDGDVTPGSGNQWHSKLDVRGKKITWSNKWTAQSTFTVNDALIEEFVAATSGPGSSGSDRMGALAVRMAHNDFIIMRAGDFLDLMREEPIIPSVKADQRRATARVPQLFRESGEN